MDLKVNHTALAILGAVIMSGKASFAEVADEGDPGLNEAISAFHHLVNSGYLSIDSEGRLNLEKPITDILRNAGAINDVNSSSRDGTECGGAITSVISRNK